MPSGPLRRILAALIVERLNIVLDGVELAILSAARGPFARIGASRIDRVTTPALRALNIEPFTAPQFTVVHRTHGDAFELLSEARPVPLAHSSHDHSLVTDWSQ